MYQKEWHFYRRKTEQMLWKPFRKWTGKSCQENPFRLACSWTDTSENIYWRTSSTTSLWWVAWAVEHHSQVCRTKCRCALKWHHKWWWWGQAEEDLVGSRNPWWTNKTWCIRDNKRNTSNNKWWWCSKAWWDQEDHMEWDTRVEEAWWVSKDNLNIRETWAARTEVEETQEDKIRDQEVGVLVDNSRWFQQREHATLGKDKAWSNSKECHNNRYHSNRLLSNSQRNNKVVSRATALPRTLILTESSIPRSTEKKRSSILAKSSIHLSTPENQRLLPKSRECCSRLTTKSWSTIPRTLTIWSERSRKQQTCLRGTIRPQTPEVANQCHKEGNLD